jgi:hypothetical protein
MVRELDLDISSMIFPVPYNANSNATNRIGICIHIYIKRLPAQRK